MRNVVVFGAASGPIPARMPGTQSVIVDGVRVRCDVVETPDVIFDTAAPTTAHKVLIRVRAVSCNYRDKSICYAMHRVPASRYSAIGSEFMAEVVETGMHVRDLHAGDRVIPNHHYTGRGTDDDGVREGVITNQGSKEYQIHPAKKLVKIPAALSNEEAAGFSLGAQTAYSMVRRVSPQAGDRLLVTSATSNTSLFILAALHRHDVRVYASTTSPEAADRLKALGATDVVAVERSTGGIRGSSALNSLAGRLGGFEAVLDPFADLHLEKAVDVLKPFGTYITCGFAAQNPHSARTVRPQHAVDSTRILHRMIVKNLTIVGNCIGLRDDLQHALDDCSAGRLDPVLDSVYSSNAIAGFLDRTFNEPARFGKVVYRYQS